MRTRARAAIIGAITSIALVGAAAPGAGAGVRAATDGPEAGVRYSADESGVEVDVYLVPPSTERQVLVFLRIECDGFTPEARVIVPLRRSVFRVRGTFSDPGTTDVVEAVIELTGRFRDETARVEVAVDLEAYDNSGATGSCDREARVDLEGNDDDALGAMSASLALPGNRVPALATDGDTLVVASRGSRRSAVMVVDPDGAVARRSRVDTTADRIAVVDDALWTLDAEAGTLTQRDLDTGEEVASVEVGASVDDTPPGDPSRAVDALAVAGDSLWTATATEILRIDPAAATVAGRTATDGSRVLDLEASATGVYAVIEDRRDDGLTGRIVRLDPATGELAAEAAVPSPFVGPLALGPDALWTARPLERRDPVSLSVLAAGARESLVVTGLVDAPPGVWVAEPSGLRVLDPDLEVVFELPGIRGDALATNDGVVWIADAGLGRLFRFEA